MRFETPSRAGRTAPQQRKRSANVAPSTGAIQELQRTVGNRAVAQVLQRAAVRRTSSGRALVQRVGGEKIGFDLTATSDATIKAGQDLLLDQWRALRQREHDLKVGAEKTDVEAGAQELIAHRTRQKEREEYRKAHPTTSSNPELTTAGLPALPQGRTAGQGFSKYYYGKLTGRDRTKQVKLLKTAPAFADARLAVEETTGTIRYRGDSTQPYVTIGTLIKDAAAFTVKTVATGTGRDILEKRGVSTDLGGAAKEYVRDSLGVPTRRYAYVEKNYWQMMEFFMTNRHEGRFQSFMKAAGEANPDLFEARQPEVDIVRGPSPTPFPTGKLTTEQLAVAHQKLGSGPQQRGVSLTSTPKVGVTYVNTGENFRTAGGFKLKIDLSLIPPHPTGPLLINHYSRGGVIEKDTMYDTTRDRSSASKYPYKESALHARELYLEYLKPEWIVAIESHATTGPGTTFDLTTALGTTPSLFQYGKSQFGGTEFERGFDEGLRTDTNSTPGDQNHTKGFGHARSFVRGWTAGHAEHTSVGATDANAALAAGITVHQHVYDKSMAVDQPDGEYDIWRMGYLQGRSGAALITTGANLPH